MTERTSIAARAYEPDGSWRLILASGQEARALAALAAAGPSGVTALECSSWAYRLAAYCHALRRKHGLAIVTQRENHPGGWHGRHVLQTPVEILRADGREKWEAAA